MKILQIFLKKFCEFRPSFQDQVFRRFLYCKTKKSYHDHYKLETI